MDRAKFARMKLPDAPGVYFFIGPRKEILYIGRATSLLHRVKSYFDDDIASKRSPAIEKMVRESVRIDVEETDSVLEAIILEVNLIRTHKPRYNTLSKDDKSYNHVAITDEEFPRVLVLRGKDLRDVKHEWSYSHVYGPFPSGKLLRDALRIIRRIFKFYDVKRPIREKMSKVLRGTIDFNRQIGLYPESTSPDAYQETIRHIRLFFEGRKRTVIAELKRDMTRFAKQERFEEAGEAKRKILALEHIQDVSLLRDDLRAYRDDRSMRIEAYDIAHLAGTHMVGVFTVVEGGKPDPSSYRKFNVRGFTASNDPGALREVLERRLRHEEWRIPDLIVVDGNAVQKRVAERAAKAAGVVVPVAAVVKDERHRPERILGPRHIVEARAEEILLANAEAHRFAIAFHRRKRGKLPE
ncbi:MAG TPA: GIY-YIG nuclease family protein [Candidatus Paceibacterota bacterium]|nr:GIY-YIG nuclease family protein [Candidatus Paceibacterota bacterium]